MKSKITECLAIVANIISIAGISAVTAYEVIIPRFFPSVTIKGPPQIYSHEQVVFGVYAPARDGYQVRLYVYPEDGMHRYWLQEQKWETPSNGAWADLARLGNPYGIDMKDPPPLDFRVFAVLIRSEDVVKLPGFGQEPSWVQENSDKAFMERLKKAGAEAVSAPYRVHRFPEDICHSTPTLTSINNNTISLNVKPLQVTSPVRLQWEPNTRMYVELWKGGKMILGKDMSRDEVLPMEAGTYEIKIRPQREYRCFASVWVDVLVNGVLSGKEREFR